jgi:hypothetical protein
VKILTNEDISIALVCLYSWPKKESDDEEEVSAHLGAHPHPVYPESLDLGQLTYMLDSGWISWTS